MWSMSQVKMAPMAGWRLRDAGGAEEQVSYAAEEKRNRGCNMLRSGETDGNQGMGGWTVVLVVASETWVAFSV
jgi:hypothetical protein